MPEREGIKRRELAVTCPAFTEERGGIAPKPTAQSQAVLKSSLAAYGSDDGSDNGSEVLYDSAEDEDARKIQRDQMRQDKRREHRFILIGLVLRVQEQLFQRCRGSAAV